MTEILDQKKFAPLVDTDFRVYDGGGGTYTLTLVAVTDVKASASHEEFVVSFRGAGEFFLPQGLYGFEHDAIALFDLFIVPTGQDADGYMYEAVFSRLTRGV